MHPHWAEVCGVAPFEAPSKDVEVVNYAQPFVDALRAIPAAEVVSQPSWELYHMSPEAGK